MFLPSMILLSQLATLFAGTYIWNSVHQYSGETINVYRTDPKWPYRTGNFLITVMAVQTNSIYSIVAAQDNTNIVLQDGIPQQDNILAGKYDYFQFDVSQSSCRVSFTVTAITGDPDIYISTVTQKPTSTNFERAGTAGGSDQIDYTPSQAAQPRTYFIGVFAYSNTTFTMLANTRCPGDDSSYVFMIDGMPQYGQLFYHQYRYYQVDVRGHHRDFTVSTNRRTGNPNIYITSNITHGRPSTSNYQWKSENSV
jgi:hypothetical protein